MRDAGFNMYRLDVDLALDTLPAFHFAIVHNWRADEAYILAEPNKLLGDTIALTIGNEPYTFVRNTLNNEAQYLFAVRIFEALKADVPLLFVDTGKPILGDKNLAKANKKALEDYFKLIYKLR
jgi:hypothetical protein